MRHLVILTCLNLLSAILFAQGGKKSSIVIAIAPQTSPLAIDANNKLIETSKGIRDVKIKLSTGPLKNAITINFSLQQSHLMSNPILETSTITLYPGDLSGGSANKTLQVRLSPLECLTTGEAFIISAVSPGKNVLISGSINVIINAIPIVPAPQITISQGTSAVKPNSRSGNLNDDGLRTITLDVLLNGRQTAGTSSNLSFQIPDYAHEQSSSKPELLTSTAISIPSTAFRADGCPEHIKIPVVIKLAPINSQAEEEKIPIIISGDTKHAHLLIIGSEVAKKNVEAVEKKDTGAFTHACSGGKIFQLSVTSIKNGGVIIIKEVTDSKSYKYSYVSYFHATNFSKWLFNIYGPAIQTGVYDDCVTFMAARVQQEISVATINSGKDTATQKTTGIPKAAVAGTDAKTETKSETKVTVDTISFQKTYLYNDVIYNTSIKQFSGKTHIKICSNTQDPTCYEETITGKLDYKMFSLVTKELIRKTFGHDQADSTKFNPLLGKQFTDFTDKVADNEKKKKQQDEKNNNDTIIARQQRKILELVQEMKDSDKAAGKIYLHKKTNLYQKDGNGKYQIIGYMEIVDASAQIDNNKIFDITFIAIRYDNEHNLIGKLNPISNNEFSLSFKGLNNREYTNTISDKAKKKEESNQPFFNYADVIEFRPHKGDFSPIVKSERYPLFPDSAVTIYRRRYSDYLSFRTFLDPLGFLGTNPNGFAQLEGDAVLPVSVRNFGQITWLPEIHANFSYLYTNTINSEKRQARTFYLANDSFFVYDTARRDFVKKGDSSSYMYNLDIVRNAYYQLYIRGAAISWEIKRQNSWLNLEFGFRVFGTTVAAKPDTAKYHKIVPEINLKWILRPDNIFGADLNIGLSWLSNLHRANNDPFNINNPAFLWKSTLAIPHELNIYVQTGKESKGGLFFRYNGWYSVNSKLANTIDERLLPSTTQTRKTSYFPQILFGYSTNLSTMIKRSGDEK